MGADAYCDAGAVQPDRGVFAGTVHDLEDLFLVPLAVKHPPRGFGRWQLLLLSRLLGRKGASTASSKTL